MTASLGWFNVRDYGAVRDSSTDNLSAINAAIAAFNANGGGVLYFPGGSGYYKTTAGLDAITNPGTVLGDGGIGGASAVYCTSATAAIFTAASPGLNFYDLYIRCSSGSPASAGGGIVATNSDSCRYENLSLINCWVGLDTQVGMIWGVTGCDIENPVKYGIKVQNIGTPDGGDSFITNSVISSGIASDAAIRQESGGGLKISNVKVNGGTGANRFTTGIDVGIGSGDNTVLLLISNTSVENVTTDAVRVYTSGTGQFGMVAINGLQVGLYGNNAGRAVKIDAAATGGLGTAGGIGDVVIAGSVFHTDGTARAAVELVKSNNVRLGEYVISGFNARYTGSGDTNTVDDG